MSQVDDPCRLFVYRWVTVDLLHTRMAGKILCMFPPTLYTESLKRALVTVSIQFHRHGFTVLPITSACHVYEYISNQTPTKLRRRCFFGSVLSSSFPVLFFSFFSRELLVN